MSWIKVVDEGEATGELKKVYERIKKERGKIANIMKVHSLNPSTMEDHMRLYRNIMFGSNGLKRDERELLAVVVSALNGCEYCINHHAEALNHYWKDREKIQNLIKDYRSVELPERLKAMISYAFKLTKTPWEMKEEDVFSLKNTGFSDADILTINLIVSYFNFVNRIALGLGVEFTEDEVTGYRY